MSGRRRSAPAAAGSGRPRYSPFALLRERRMDIVLCEAALITAGRRDDARHGGGILTCRFGSRSGHAPTFAGPARTGHRSKDKVIGLAGRRPLSGDRHLHGTPCRFGGLPNGEGRHCLQTERHRARPE